MATANGKRAGVALLIGIGDYLHADRVERLPFAPRDAKSLTRLLTNPDVCAFPEDSVALLLDHKASRRPIIERLSEWLPAQARGAEIVLLYFAGHGTVRRLGPKEEGFLVPHDADPDDIAAGGIAMSDVARWVEGIEAGAVVVVFDCCHAGKVLGEGHSIRSGERDMELRPSVLQAVAGKGRFLIASCDEGQKSLESPELKHGLFTYHLLKGIAGAGDRDGDGKVGVAELFNYVSQAVARDAREKFGREQTPWTSATWTGDAYISRPTARPDTAGLSPLERRWNEEGAGAVVRDFEAIPQAEEERLITALRFVRRKREPVAVPFVFRCLAHSAAAVRQRARSAVQVIGWDAAAAAVEGLARAPDEARLGFVLEGLAAVEADAAVVALLNRLTVLLRGDLRDRAAFLHARKVAGLELEKTAAVFRDKQSPYRIERALGAGLFTAAYLARDEFADLRVVVRVLRPEFAAQPVVRGHFLDLGRRAVRFVHQNLVLTRGVQLFPDRDLYCAVRDYIDGPTLREVLANGKRFEARQVLEILRQILEGLTPLHREGAWHGGVRPTNVFLTADGRAILGDPSLPIPPATAEVQRLAYDFRYAAPETFRAGAALGPASDFYALGCVAHELCCGAPPFVSDSHYELIAMHDRDAIGPPSRAGSLLGPAGDPFLLRLLARSPAERFPDIGAALCGLDALARPAPSAPPGRMFVQPVPLPSQSLARYRDRQSLLNLGEADQGTVPPYMSLDPEASLPSVGAAAGAALPEIPGYEILGELGRGGMGVVYRARHLALNRIVALKTLAYSHGAGAEVLRRFLAEAQAVAGLQHPNIIQIYEIGEHSGLPFFSLEFCGGGTLAEKARGGLLPPQDAAGLVETLARAVQYAHEHGVIHRDLKPANVLLTEDGTPKLTDFGLAKRLERNDPVLTAVGQIMGTPAFMAPEQATGDLAAVGPLTDVYGLGAVLYTLLTGRAPFVDTSVARMLAQLITEEPPPPRSLQPQVPRDLETICLKCLEKDPKKRYPSAAALAEELRRCRSGESIRSRAATPLRRAGKWVRRRPMVAALAALVLLLLGALVVMGWLYLSMWAGAAPPVKGAVYFFPRSLDGLCRGPQPVREEAPRHFHGERPVMVLPALVPRRA